MILIDLKSRLVFAPHVRKELHVFFKFANLNELYNMNEHNLF